MFHYTTAATVSVKNLMTIRNEINGNFQPKLFSQIDLDFARKRIVARDFWDGRARWRMAKHSNGTFGQTLETAKRLFTSQAESSAVQWREVFQTIQREK